MGILSSASHAEDTRSIPVGTTNLRRGGNKRLQLDPSRFFALEDGGLKPASLALVVRSVTRG
jgi:hypothetical protein